LKIFLVFLLLTQALLFAQPQFSRISSMPGAFSRMGFGARGIGMGNAMSAVTEGNLVSYYNPALSAFQKGNLFQTSYSFLALDRSLNFLSFTKRFDFSSKDTSRKRSAGISLGIINSGVGNIDGRDNEGVQTENLSTSENQFFIGFANRFSEKLSIGISAKFYYYKLYKSVSATSVGVDLGALYVLNEHINLSLMISDINSKYNWDSTPLYGQSGTITEDKFPLLKKIGVSYSQKKIGLIAAVEYENSNGGTNIIRGGVEYNIIDKLFIRAGVDQFNLSNSDFPAKPAFGFSYFKDFNNITVGVDYAFMVEQYSNQDRHIVGLSVNF
jgi:opacity protein-like surface antigen